jgi:hypothetical protein
MVEREVRKESKVCLTNPSLIFLIGWQGYFCVLHSETSRTMPKINRMSDRKQIEAPLAAIYIPRRQGTFGMFINENGSFGKETRVRPQAEYGHVTFHVIVLNNLGISQVDVFIL